MLSSTFWHVLAESILFVALGQTIAFCEAKMLCLKANLLREKALLPKVNLLLAKALLQKAALLDWSAPGLSDRTNPRCWTSGDFSSPLRVQTGPGVHSASYKMSTGSFSKGKLVSTSPSELSWPVKGTTFTFDLRTLNLSYNKYFKQFFLC